MQTMTCLGTLILALSWMMTLCRPASPLQPQVSPRYFAHEPAFQAYLFSLLSCLTSLHSYECDHQSQVCTGLEPTAGEPQQSLSAEDAESDQPSNSRDSGPRPQPSVSELDQPDADSTSEISLRDVSRLRPGRPSAQLHSIAEEQDEQDAPARAVQQPAQSSPYAATATAVSYATAKQAAKDLHNDETAEDIQSPAGAFQQLCHCHHLLRNEARKGVYVTS